MRLIDNIIKENPDDAYIRFTSVGSRLNMTVIGDPDNNTTAAANHCVAIFSNFLERMGLDNDDDDLQFMDVEGNA